jgi:hypothetical protein
LSAFEGVKGKRHEPQWHRKDQALNGEGLAQLKVTKPITEIDKFKKRSQLFVGSDNEPLFRRRGARQQSRSFAGWNQLLRRSPNFNRF